MWVKRPCVLASTLSRLCGAIDFPDTLQGSRLKPDFAGNHILSYLVFPLAYRLPLCLSSSYESTLLINALHKHIISDSVSGTLALKGCHNLFLECPHIPFILSLIHI